MATFAKQLISCFLLIILCTCPIESRESKFFFKYVHVLKKDVLSSSPTPAPQPISNQISNVPIMAPVGSNYGLAPAPAPKTLQVNYDPTPAPSPLTLGSDNDNVESESNWYYGLYAKANDSPQDKAEFETESSTKNPVFSTKEFSYEPENEYSNEKREENGYGNNLNNENGFWNSNHKDYKMEPEEVRSNNYNDVEHNNYSLGGNELAKENNYEEGYYYGNYNKSKYEFDSIEEYEKQNGYANVQQDFIP